MIQSTQSWTSFARKKPRRHFGPSCGKENNTFRVFNIEGVMANEDLPFPSRRNTPHKASPKTAICLSEKSSLQELDLFGQQSLEIFAFEYAKVSTRKHLQLLRLSGTTVCFEHCCCNANNIFLRYLHQERRGSNLVNASGWEILYYAFETVMCIVSKTS